MSNTLHPTRRGGILKKLLITLAIIIALVVLLVGYEVFLALTATPAATQNYSRQIHDQALARQRAIFGEGLNQWPRFEAAMLEVEAASQWLEEYNESIPDQERYSPYGYIHFYHLMSFSDEGGTKEQYEVGRRRALEVLEHWRSIGIFDRAAEIASLERVAVPPVDGPTIDVILPHLGDARQLTRAQAARMRVAVERDDHDQALTAFEESLALGRIVSGQGTLISWLSGMAMDALVLDQLAQCLLLHPVPDERWLIAADAAIERESFEYYPSFQHILENERLENAAEIQRFFTASGRFIPLEFARQSHAYDMADAPDEILPFGDTRFSNLHGRLFLSRRETDAWLDRAHELAVEAVTTTGSDSIAADRAIEAFTDDVDWRNPIAEYSSILSSLATIERMRQINAVGTRVLLAIERYRLRNGGAIPQTLDDLGDLLPASLRTDPFTEQPWDYQPTPATTRNNGTPLKPNDTAWPYTLRSRALPGSPPSSRVNDPNKGILINRPAQGPDFDE